MTDTGNISETIRINRILKEFNIGMNTLIEFLRSKKIEVEASPATKITPEIYALVQKEFGKEQIIKEQSKKIAIKVKDITDKADSEKSDEGEEYVPVREVFIKTTIVEPPAPKIIGKIDLDRGSKPSEPKKEVPLATPTVSKESAPAVSGTQTETPFVPVTPATQGTPAASATTTASATTPAHETPATPAAPVTPVQADQPEADAKPVQVSKAAIVEKNSIPEKDSGERKKQEEPLKERPDTNLSKESSFTPKNDKPQVKTTDKREEQPTRGERRASPQQQPSVSSQDLSSALSRIEHIETRIEKLKGVKISGSIDLSQFEKKKGEQKNGTPSQKPAAKGKRERIHKPAREKIDPFRDNRQDSSSRTKEGTGKTGKHQRERFKPVRTEVDEDAVQKQIKETYAKMTENKGKTKGSKYRRDKREIISQRMHEEQELQEMSSNILKVTEFVTVNDLSVMMNVTVTKVIEACMNLGLMVSINQRLDAEALVLVAEEFGFKVEFVTADIQDSIQEEADKPEDLQPR
ncbi:MAG: translation initiation factor IF-2 N-terminal domain-containing protein, partial [Bacteroidales bacterium]|nr:translation initiation factor IF-2 N-terminal domain-containing protein [Bacteroidales bacterium]